MPSNKARLYVALYVRGGAAKMPGEEDTYHWALLVGPKSDKADDEEKPATMAPMQMILIRILIGKIEHTDRLAQILQQIPIRQEQQGWNCVLWIKEALSVLQAATNVMGTSVLDWEAVRSAAMSYCQRKRDEHRFDGTTNVDTSRIPTFDLIQGKETIK
ncbi:hypothetical protein KCU81_g1582, partial [Aureobasidium melanogenum]|uniref:Uncharacterized protein n=1 Tax=Aureobasidium melanogenum (strain CBS 110374) TaxID=1043003 RepID=A0A074VUB9_AURM1